MFGWRRKKGRVPSPERAEAIARIDQAVRAARQEEDRAFQQDLDRLKTRSASRAIDRPQPAP